MDGAELRDAMGQFLSIGFHLLEAIFVLFGAALIARALRRLVRRRLAATLAPENAKRIAENIVTLGLQGVLQSLVAGIFILFERPFNVGDHVSFSVHDVEGTVEEISLRTT